MSITNLLKLALATAVVACESPASPVVGPGDAQYAVANSVGTTCVTIDAVTLTAGQPGQIVAHLWTAGHPLGGRQMKLSIDGTIVDTTRGSNYGTVSFSVPGLASGQHSVSVSFDGDKNFAGSNATITISIP